MPKTTSSGSYNVHEIVEEPSVEVAAVQFIEPAEQPASEPQKPAEKPVEQKAPESTPTSSALPAVAPVTAADVQKASPIGKSTTQK